MVSLCLHGLPVFLSYSAVVLQFQQHSLVLLGDGQRGRVDPLVDLLPLSSLEGVQTLSAVTHPASMHRDGELSVATRTSPITPTHFSKSTIYTHISQTQVSLNAHKMI